MKYSKAISVACFVMSGCSLIIGTLLSVILSASGLFLGNAAFGMGLGLFVAFMVITIVTKLFSDRGK